MGVPEIVKRLSHVQRELLVEHVHGPRPIDYRRGASSANARKITACLVDRNLIQPDGPANRIKPKATALTELGREVAAFILAYYAEQLVRAGALDDMSAIKMTPTAAREMRLMTPSTTALTESLPESPNVASSTENADVHESGHDPPLNQARGD